MTPRQFLCELAIVVIWAAWLACATPPDGFQKLAQHVAGLVG